MKCSGEAPTRRLCLACTYTVTVLYSLSAATVLREHLPTASPFSSIDKKKSEESSCGPGLWAEERAVPAGLLLAQVEAVLAVPASASSGHVPAQKVVLGRLHAPHHPGSCSL